MDMIIPEASLIDIRKISKDCQNKFSQILNYSRLFDLKEEYRYPIKQLSFFGTNCSYYAYHLTKNMKVVNDNIIHLCAKKYSGGFHDKDYEKNDNNNMFSIRPVFRYSDIKDYCNIVEELAPGYLVVTFGCYPQRKIGHLTDYDSRKIHYSSEGYTLRIYGKNVLYNVVSIDGQKDKYVEKNSYLYLVEPVRFLVDIKNDFAISEYCLMEMKPNIESKIAFFEGTTFYKFLNTYFVPELMRNMIRQKEQDVIETNEIPEIKSLIDSIIKASENSVLEEIIKRELQALINEYNTCIDKEKETDDSDITLDLTELSSDELFINKFRALFSKITDHPYYHDSKIIYECLNINANDNKEIASELYKDLTVIYKIILPSLPENIRLSYQVRIRKILEDAKSILITSYQTQAKVKMNIELIVREKLQSILEDLYNDVTKNYILINLEDIINGIFKSSNDQYLAYIFDLINEEVKSIEILISLTKKEEYSPELREILKNDEGNYTFNYLIEIYLKLLKLKERLEKIDIKRTAFERKKIRRKII